MAGGKAAETLREAGFDGRDRPAGRRGRAALRAPAAEQGLLRGEAGRDAVYLQKDPAWYEQHAIELRTETRSRRSTSAPARSCSPAASGWPTTRLLLATGAQPRRPPIPGAELDGVHVLRTVEDSDALRAVLDARRAARRHRRGLDRLRGRGLGAPARHGGGHGRDAVAAAGGRARPRARRLLSRRARRARRGAAPRPRRRGHRGRRAAPSACAPPTAPSSSAPRCCSASASRRAPHWPRACSRSTTGSSSTRGLRTSADGIFAAGDVANHEHPLFGPAPRRALGQRAEAGPGRRARHARRGRPYERVPYFFSDQYDVGMEYAGHGRPDDEVVFRGDPADARVHRLLAARRLRARPG